MLLGADNRKKWSHLDILVMQAYQTVQDEKCSQCGYPRWICQSDDPKLQVRVNEYHCYGKQELEKYDEAHREDGQKGVSTYPEWYHLDGEPLINFRDLYYEQQAREAASEAAEEDQD